MRTLYLRNVPDEIVARLEELARRDHSSVTAVAVRELAESSRRFDNPALLEDLPDTGVSTGTIVANLDEDRRPPVIVLAAGAALAGLLIGERRER